MPDKPSIILFGTWGEDNTGDDILLLSQIEGIRERSPDCLIICFSGDPAHTRALLERELASQEGIEVVYTGRRGLREPGLPFGRSFRWIRENISSIARSRLLVIGPGNQIQDVTRRMRVLFFLARAVLAWLLRTPFAFVGIGFYELRSRFCRWLFRVSCDRADFISTRDSGGADKIIEIGVKNSRIHPLADFSFSQNHPEPPENQIGGRTAPLIGLTTRVFLPEVFPPTVAGNFEFCLAELLRRIQKDIPVQFRYFPFYMGSVWNDNVAFERLKDQLSDTVFPHETYDFSYLTDLRSAISECDAFIGVRYHSVLLSVQGGVPVMGISYAHKTERFMRENGLGDFVVTVEDVTAERLRAVWGRLWENRIQLRRQLPHINERERMLARQHFDLIFETINRR